MMSGLTSVTLPDSVTTTDVGAFLDCHSLKEITLSKNLKNIGVSMLANCDHLTSVTIPDGVTKIKEYAFYGCSRLSSIVIPNSVTKIEAKAFTGCDKLTIKGNSDSYAQTYAQKNGIPFEDINAPKISVPKNLTLGVKETYALDAKGAKFKSSDKAVAEVSDKGVITAKKVGSATITATVGGKKHTCKVKVVKAPDAISFDDKAVTLGVKETLTLKPTITKGSHTSYTWSVKDKNIATVDKEGVVTAKKAGKTTVTVKTHNGLKATITVQIQKAPDKVALKPKSVTLGVKEAITITPTIKKGTHASYTWSVKDKKIATVSKNGKITGVKTGKTTVTVQTQNGKKATMTVEVVKAPSRISFDEKSVALGVKESFTLKPAINKGTHASYTWSVKDKKVAKVTKDGKITGVKAGTTTVTVKTHNGKKATLTVKVLEAPDSITLSSNKRTLHVGDMIMLMPTLPKKTASKITWSSDKKSVVSVDADGVVKALKKGKAKITAKTFNGKKAVCTVTVDEGPGTLYFDVESLSIGVEEKVKLTLVVNEEAKATFKWSSKDKKIATVNKKGYVTGVKKGSTEITVKTQNNLTATLKVTVLAAPSKVTLNKKKAEIAEGGTLQLEAKLPKKTASQIKWTSSAKKVATVDKNGLVTAVGAGKATITAETFNGKKAECKVTVREAGLEDKLFDVFDMTGAPDDGIYVDNFNDLMIPLLSIEDFGVAENSEEWAELAEFIEKQNGLIKRTNNAIAEYQRAVEEFAESFGQIDEVLGTVNIRATDDGFEFENDVLSFSVITNPSANYIKKQNTAVKIQLNGMDAIIVPRMQDNQYNENPDAQSNDGKTENLSTIANHIKNAVDWVNLIKDWVNVVYPKLLAVQESATQFRVNCGIDKGKANEDVQKLERDLVKAKPADKEKIREKLETAKKTLKRLSDVHDIAKDIEKSVEWVCKKMDKLIKFYQAAGVDLAFDLVSVKDLVKIHSHGHPVGREISDEVRSKYVDKMKKTMQTTKNAVIGSLSYHVGILVLELASWSPQGKIAGILNKVMGKKLATWIVSKYAFLTGKIAATSKWAKVQQISGITGLFAIDQFSSNTIQKRMGEINKYDDILHGKIRGTISGKVVDANTKKPIKGALVESDEKSKYTNADGTFVLSAMYGMYKEKYALTCTKEGYAEAKGVAEVDEDCSDAVIRIEMSKDGIPIDAEHFPDDIFRSCVKQFDLDDNDALSDEEIGEVKSINVDNCSIVSLEGIQYLIALEELSCANNQLTELNINSCSSLITLICSNNAVTVMDLGGCTKLQTLNCGYNGLTALNIKDCADLRKLFCNSNQLTELDLTGLVSLTDLNCGDNKLTKLTVNGLKNLQVLNCSVNQLTELEVMSCSALTTLYCSENYNGPHVKTSNEELMVNNRS